MRADAGPQIDWERTLAAAWTLAVTASATASMRAIRRWFVLTTAEVVD